jgi:hypothetical integral membrane protein (TIGR02206 family)
MPFHPFTPAHYTALGIGALITAVLLLAGKHGGKNERFVTFALAFANLAAWPIHLIAWRNYPKALDNILPLHLCDLAGFAAGFALITRRPLLCALAYFWGLAATIQGLITPAITYGPPAAPFISFFFQHFAVVAAALYIPIVLGWRPTAPWWKTPLVVFCISLGYQGVALLVNFTLGTNFAFASRPPDNPSLIDHLGPWPVYLFAMQGLALILFLLLALPLRSGKTK